jgi:hypothetical protein
MLTKLIELIELIELIGLAELIISTIQPNQPLFSNFCHLTSVLSCFVQPPQRRNAATPPRRAGAVEKRG